MIRPQMDLIRARLDYATSKDEKRKLLTDLVAQYDKLIQVAEIVAQTPASPGERYTPSKAPSELLFLKSERIRVQISRDLLD